MGPWRGPHSTFQKERHLAGSLAFKKQQSAKLDKVRVTWMGSRGSDVVALPPHSLRVLTALLGDATCVTGKQFIRNRQGYLGGRG